MLYIILLPFAGFGAYRVLSLVSNLVLSHIREKRHVRKFSLSTETINKGFQPNNQGRSIDLVVSSLQSQDIDIVFYVDYNS